MPGNQDDQGKGKEALLPGNLKEQHHEEKYPGPADHGADDDQPLGRNGGTHSLLPVLGSGNPQRAEENVEALLRREESRIEQQGPAEGERGGGGIPGLLLGKSPVIPEFGGALLQEGGIGEDGAVTGQGIERMSRTERLAGGSRLLRNRGAKRRENNKGSRHGNQQES